MGDDRTAKGLTLKQVAKILDVSPRRIQYLREIDLVEPDEVGLGRGRFCYYSDDDIKWLYLVLVELKSIDYTVSRKIVEAAKTTRKSKIQFSMGPASSLEIDLYELNRAVSELLGKSRSRYSRTYLK